MVVLPELMLYSFARPSLIEVGEVILFFCGLIQANL